MSFVTILQTHNLCFVHQRHEKSTYYSILSLFSPLYGCEYTILVQRYKLFVKVLLNNVSFFTNLSTFFLFSMILFF